MKCREIDRERARDEREEEESETSFPRKVSKRSEILTVSLSSTAGSSLSMIESTVAKS